MQPRTDVNTTAVGGASGLTFNTSDAKQETERHEKAGPKGFAKGEADDKKEDPTRLRRRDTQSGIAEQRHLARLTEKNQKIQSAEKNIQ